jgi:hypothetical protein
MSDIEVRVKKLLPNNSVWKSPKSRTKRLSLLISVQIPLTPLNW